MGRPVFISSFNVLAPGINGPLEFLQFLKKNTDENIPDYSASHGFINFDEHIKSYPKKAELKSMRDDVLAAVVCVSGLMEKSGLAPSQFVNFPFFISSGCFLMEIAEIIASMKGYYSSVSGTFAELDNPLNIYEMIPPLTALRTLTNAIESFSSLNTGLAGDNTTFGSTSASGFYAMKEAWQRIASGSAEIAVAGGADIGEEYSKLMFKNFTEPSDGWVNSACAAFFILESEKSLKQRGLEPLAEITELSQAPKVPGFFSAESSEPYSYFQSAGKLNSFCVFGGGLAQNNYEREKQIIDGASIGSASLYPLMGSLGSSSVLMSLAASVCLSQIKGLDKGTILERDPYEREFIVELAYQKNNKQ